MKRGRVKARSSASRKEPLLDAVIGTAASGVDSVPTFAAGIIATIGAVLVAATPTSQKNTWLATVVNWIKKFVDTNLTPLKPFMDPICDGITAHQAGFLGGLAVGLTVNSLLKKSRYGTWRWLIFLLVVATWTALEPTKDVPVVVAVCAGALTIWTTYTKRYNWYYCFWILVAITIVATVIHQKHSAKFDGTKLTRFDD